MRLLEKRLGRREEMAIELARFARFCVHADWHLHHEEMRWDSRSGIWLFPSHLFHQPVFQLLLQQRAIAV